MPDGIAARFNTVEYDASDERLLDSVLLAPGSALLPRPGRRPGTGLEVTVGGTPEAATVAAGVGIITDSAGGGGYRFAIPTPVAVNLAARPGAGTSRIDFVVARILNEDARPGDTLREVDISIITGTAGGSPTAPTIPSGQLRLARLDVPASGSVVVSKLAQRMAAAGAVIVVADTAERDAISPVYDGMVAYREDADVFDGRVAGAWEQIFPAAPTHKVGVASITFNASGEAVLNHNFGQVPTYVSAVHDSNGTHILVYPKGGTVAANTVTLQARKLDGTAYVGSLSVVRWMVAV